MTEANIIPAFDTIEYTEYLRNRFPVCRNMDPVYFQTVSSSNTLYEMLSHGRNISFSAMPKELSPLRECGVSDIEAGDPRAYADLNSIIDDLPRTRLVGFMGQVYPKGAHIERIHIPDANGSLIHAQRCFFTHFAAPSSCFVWSNFAGSGFIQTTFSKSDLHRADFTHTSHYATDFSEAKLTKTRVRDARFVQCDFPKTIFAATKAQGALFMGNKEENCNMRGAIFSSKCDFKNSRFIFCDLSEADILPDRDMHFDGARFSHCRMPAKLKAMLEFRGATVENNCTIEMSRLSAPDGDPNYYEAWSPPQNAPRPSSVPLGSMQQAMLAGPNANAELRSQNAAEDAERDARAQKARDQGEVPENIVEQAIADGTVSSLAAARKAKGDASQR